MIEVNQVSKYYGSLKAVDQLSFRIAKGEIVGLLGLNGAGKSSILKIIACLLNSSNGDVKIGGYSVKEQAEGVRRLIGYLPDVPPLYKDMRLMDYLHFVARLKDTPRELVDEYVLDAIEKTNLAEVRTKHVKELSHGFQQRVGIAQAIVHKPKVLILDEPINGLDPMQIAEMRDLILSLKGEHTVLLSSHILSEVTKTCDRILVIHQGKLIAQGSPAEIIGRGKDAIHFSCQVEGYGSMMKTKLMSIDGLKIINEEEGPGVAKLYFEGPTDLRSEVARVVVAEGGGLLSLQKDEGELESLFLQLIKGSIQ